MRRLKGLPATAACLVFSTILLSGCSSMAEGVTRALMGSDVAKQDTRQCSIRGPAFKGLSEMMAHQTGPSEAGKHLRDLKILMVHGIGTHIPGYSTRLQEHLARSLDLDVVSDRPKQIALQQPLLFPNEKLGTVRATRYSNHEDTRSLVFYELTWSPISEPEKRAIAYDTSGEYAFRRAQLNQVMKGFVNTHMPDPLIYLGDAREKIQAAVGQAFCWMVAYDWDGLGLNSSAACPLNLLTPQKLFRDDYVFISHSLGSRIVIDSLQRLAEVTSKEGADSRLAGWTVPQDFVEAMRQKEFTLFMFANQLSLLQLGRNPPTVTNEIDQYCPVDAEKRDKRFVKRLNIIGFSDPNDILSWAVPPNYTHEYMDSRLCPTMDNVLINIAKVDNFFGAIQIANPAAAHADYEADERVISLVAQGIGEGDTAPLIKDRCEWLETR